MADPREPDLVTHNLAYSLRVRMLAIAGGYEDANDLGWLRTDPGFELACGRLAIAMPSHDLSGGSASVQHHVCIVCHATRRQIPGLLSICWKVIACGRKMSSFRRCPRRITHSMSSRRRELDYFGRRATGQ
jgi:hypothetical protein